MTRTNVQAIGQVWCVEPCSLRNNSSGDISSPKSDRSSSSVVWSLGLEGLGGCGGGSGSRSIGSGNNG